MHLPEYVGFLYQLVINWSMKAWVKKNLKMMEITQQRKFLLKCRQFDVLPPHIHNIKFYATIRHNQLNKKLHHLKKKYQRGLLNHEIRDIHSQLKVVNKGIESIERFLNRTLPSDLLNSFYESNINKL